MTRDLAGVTVEILRITTLTLGGGATTAAVLQKNFMDRGWINAEQYALSYSLARVTPSTNYFALITGLTWMLHGWRGVVLGLLAASIPTCLIAWGFTAGFALITQYPAVQRLLDGAIAASLGVTVVALWQLAGKHLLGCSRLRAWVILIASFGLVWSGLLTPVLALLLAALVGYLWPDKEPAS